MNKDLFGLKGEVSFVVQHNDGKIETFKNNNLIMLNGLYTFGEAFTYACGSATHIINGYPWIAVGTSNIFPHPNNPQLAHEVFRKQVEPNFITRMNLNNYFEISVEQNEANETLKECGLFINNASSTPDSGTLCARALIAPVIEKTIYKRLTIKWAIKIERIE